MSQSELLMMLIHQTGLHRPVFDVLRQKISEELEERDVKWEVLYREGIFTVKLARYDTLMYSWRKKHLLLELLMRHGTVETVQTVPLGTKLVLEGKCFANVTHSQWDEILVVTDWEDDEFSWVARCERGQYRLEIAMHRPGHVVVVRTNGYKSGFMNYRHTDHIAAWYCFTDAAVPAP